MKKLTILTLVLVAPALAACTDSDGAIRAAEAYGLKDVKITGYRWTGCAESDDRHTGFEATTQTGRRVTGVVCGNWGLFGKSNTVRID